MANDQKSPLREIIQPFIDLIHAPRALWGINLAYVLEGMVYFGMLGYLTIYCSEYIFQAIDGADEAAHYMVMVLTAGITISMFFLGVVADKRGVRFALIAAFICMFVGRVIWSGGPTVFGLEPVRAGVFAGDRVSLRISELDTRKGVKAITSAEVIADEADAVDPEATFALDLAAGAGIAPSAELESRFVKLDRVILLKGEKQEWTVQYGSDKITAKLVIHGADKLNLRPGTTLSLSRAYITRSKESGDKEEEEEATTAEEGEKGEAEEAEHSPEKFALRPGATLSLSEAKVVKKSKDSDEYVISVPWPEGVGAIDVSGCEEENDYVIRSHWLGDIQAVDTFPIDLTEGEGIELGEGLEDHQIQLSEVTLKEGKGQEWVVEYGGKPISAKLVIEGDKSEFSEDELVPDLALGAGRPLDADLLSKKVRLTRARLLSRKGQEWQLQYGDDALTATLLVDSGRNATLSPGADIALKDVEVWRHGSGDGQFILRADWPENFAALDTYGCAESPYRAVVPTHEKDLKAEVRAPVADQSTAVENVESITLAALRELKDGPVDVVLRNVYVTYVRTGGYFVQAEPDGPAIFVFVNPFWSPLQIMTLMGMLLVVVGYGMYQPAAYAGVRKFTTPKTAAMGFAMLYALMNLGGWLPSFAFLVRDDDYLGLGISGTFCVYTAITLLALVFTFFILSKRTVSLAEASAKEETARIKAEEEAKQEKPAEEPKAEPQVASTAPPVSETVQTRIRGHMWLFWVGAMVLFLFKGESPWYYAWGEESWRWVIVAAIFVSPIVIAAIPPLRRWIARHPLQDPKFSFFIFALIPVQTLFTYNWFILPPYINRAFEGWIGKYFEVAANANPLLIFIAVPIITALTQKAKVYNMMIYGTFIMAAPAFLLVLGPHWWTLFAYLLIMTIGEAMWQPRFLQYAAEIAPEGRTGEYMGVAQLPWFLTKVLVPLIYSGRMMDTYCPAEGAVHTEIMWFIFGCIAITSTILLMLAKPWIGKDFKTKAG